MKFPALLCSAATLLLLSACATAPSSSERSGTLRRGKIIITEAAPAPAAPAVVETPPPVAPVQPVAPVVVTPPPPVVETPPPAPITPASVAAPRLSAQRNGTVVRLNWTLPESASGYRAIEIMRNTQDQPAGRGRIHAVRATVTQFEDNVPDSLANYWYWLKITHVDGTVDNLGPAAAPTGN